MIALLACTALLAVPAPALAAPAPLLTAQPVAQEPPEDNRADVDELLDQLDKHAGARGKEDREAIAIIDQLAPKRGANPHSYYAS